MALGKFGLGSMTLSLSLSSLVIGTPPGGGGAVDVLPANTVAPTVDGTAQVGQVLTASNGTWTGSPTPTFTYQWYRGTSAISGATNASYVAVSGDQGASLSVDVTATNRAGSKTVRTAATSSVIAAPALNALSLSGTSYKTTDGEGTLIGEITGLTSGSSLAFTPNDNRLAISRTGTTARLVKGLGASSVGSFDLVLTETLGSASNSPKTTTIRLTVIDGNADPNPVGIFGFRQPTTAPTSFPGTLLTGNEVDATDASRWSKQSGEPAITISPGRIAADGTQTALRWVGYTDEEQVAATDKLAVIAKIEAANGNLNVNSSVSGTSTVTNTSRLGWKQGIFQCSAVSNPRVGVQFNPSVVAHFSQLRGYNLSKLLAQKWAIVFTVGQSNGNGSTAIADPAIDTPVEGCVVFPGETNTYTGAKISTPMIAVDPVQHQSLNGSSSAYGGGPSGSFCRELRRLIPGDYTIVFVALNYNGEGFKANGLWNKNNTARDPIAYKNAWIRMREVYGMAPAGSVVLGLLMCGGESDLGSGNEVEWQSKVTGFPAYVDEVRAEPGWGQVPVVIMEIGMPLDDANVQSMIRLQKKLATGSGDALEYPRCRYVPRPTNWALGSDNVHYDQATHRQRGIDAARALASIVYPT